MLLFGEHESAVAPERHPDADFPRCGQMPPLGRVWWPDLSKAVFPAAARSPSPRRTLEVADAVRHCYRAVMDVTTVTFLDHIAVSARCLKSKRDHRRCGGIPYRMCSKVSNADDPDQRNDRRCYQQDR